MPFTRSVADVVSMPGPPSAAVRPRTRPAGRAEPEKPGPGGAAAQGVFAQAYLSYPHSGLAERARSIVGRHGSPDQNAFRIVRWVASRIACHADGTAPGLKTWWQPPAVTCRKRVGDDEDRALLVHSLLLHSGVPWHRIRTYGGWEPAGRDTEAVRRVWTAYRRESDDEWVVLDTSCLPDTRSVGDRIPMRLTGIHGLRMAFCISAAYALEAKGGHRIVDHGIYTASGHRTDRIAFPEGLLIDRYA